MSTIYLDIEAIPCQRADLTDDIIAKVKPPATLKKAESIAAWERDERPAAIAEAIDKTALDGTYGQVCCIGWAVDDEEANSLVVNDLSADEEQKLLMHFWSYMRTMHSTSGRQHVVVGHNLLGYDLPFLAKRSVIHGTKPPFWWPQKPKPWSETVSDTMLMWAGDRGMIGLDRLCRVLGVEGKGDGPTGADVWPLAQAGNWEEIATYCRAGVDRTRSVYRRITFA